MFTSASSSKALYDTVGADISLNTSVAVGGVGAPVLGGGGGGAAICSAPRLRLASYFSLLLGAAAVEVAGLAGFAAFPAGFAAGAGTGGLLGTTWVPARLHFWPMWVASTISATAASVQVAGGGRRGVGAGAGGAPWPAAATRMDGGGVDEAGGGERRLGNFPSRAQS